MQNVGATYKQSMFNCCPGNPVWKWDLAAEEFFETSERSPDISGLEHASFLDRWFLFKTICLQTTLVWGKGDGEVDIGGDGGIEQKEKEKIENSWT